MPQVTELKTIGDVDAMLDASHSRPVVLFKHSAMCSLSRRAQSSVSTLATDDGPPLYFVVVQHARPVSDAIAERLGVRHETPQALVIAEGRVTLHLSHHAIQADRLHEATRLAA